VGTKEEGEMEERHRPGGYYVENLKGKKKRPGRRKEGSRSFGKARLEKN